MEEYAYPPSKICYLYNEQTGMFEGTAYAYLEPPFLEPNYYAPPNSVYVKPRGELEVGRGYKINEKRTGWISVTDWSGVPLWYKETALPAPGLAPGERLPQELTHYEPPACEPHQWPRWDADGMVWSIGPNNQGVMWFDGNGNEGALLSPWEEIPEGAQQGQSPQRKQAKMRAAQKRLLSDANDLIELCQEMLEMPTATTGDAELLAQAKAYKKAVMQIDILSDPDTFQEPQFPHVRFGQGQLLGE